MRKKVDLTIHWLEYDSADELAKDDRELLGSAVRVLENAYAPYSMFKVGAAVRLENGEIVTGTNVENAAFPSGICAEQNALSTSASCYPGIKPVAIAIAGKAGGEPTDDPVPPCGNCRQVIAEEEGRNRHSVRIIMKGKKKIIVVEKGGDLLPIQFNKNNLRRDSL